MFSTRLSRGLLALAVLALSACQVDVAVRLDVTENGSGTVELNALFDEAAATAIGDLGSQLRVSDLARAGWRVDPETAADGSVRIVATKAVSGPDEWQSVLDEIAGPGVFTNVAVTSSDAFANTRQRVSYTLDLGDGWDLFSDQGVADALQGEPFGAPIETLTDGRSPDEIVAIALTTSVSSDDEASASASTATPRFDDGDVVRISIESTTENSTAVLLRWIAIALGSLFLLAMVLAITGVVLQRRADRLRPAPTPASLASRVPGSREPAGAPAAAAAAVRHAPDSVRLVVVEPRTVFYQPTDSAEADLLPFVRHNGGTARADTIDEAHESVMSGAMDTETFWDLCGVEGDLSAADDTFMNTRRLHPSVAGFLQEMQKRRIPVAAVTNDAIAWSESVRDRDRLSAVWPWLISAEIGARKPNLAMFEVLRRESGVAYGHCLYVDTDLESLDAARELGMKTALFDTGVVELPDIVGHPTVTNLKALFGK